MLLSIPAAGTEPPTPSSQDTSEHLPIPRAPRQPEALGWLLTNCKKKKKQPTKTMGFGVFLQQRQGHLAEILHSEICSECLNEAPYSDFEQLSIQSRGLQAGKISLHHHSSWGGRRQRTRTAAGLPLTSDSPRAPQPPQTRVSSRAPSAVKLPVLWGLSRRQPEPPPRNTVPDKLMYLVTSWAQAGPTLKHDLLALKLESQQIKSTAFSGLDFLQ